MVESNHVRQMKVVGVPHSPQSICKTQVGHIYSTGNSSFGNTAANSGTWGKQKKKKKTFSW
jgi:hypothetical protein